MEVFRRSCSCSGFLQYGPKMVIFTKAIRVSPRDGGLLSAWVFVIDCFQ